MLAVPMVAVTILLAVAQIALANAKPLAKKRDIVYAVIKSNNKQMKTTR
jgi:hypothetical protein